MPPVSRVRLVRTIRGLGYDVVRQGTVVVDFVDGGVCTIQYPDGTTARVPPGDSRKPKVSRVMQLIRQWARVDVREIPHVHGLLNVEWR